MAVARTLRRAYDIRLEELGLNLSEAGLLAFVLEQGPITQTELARRLRLGRAATGAIIDVLEPLGLVERQRSPGDRRVWMVAATAGAAGVGARIDAIDRQLREQLRAGITKAERQQLAVTLTRLQHNLAAVVDDL